MFKNQAELDVFISEWTKNHPEALGLSVELDYPNRIFDADFKEHFTYELEEQLIEDLELAGNYGVLWSKQFHLPTYFGELGRGVENCLKHFGCTQTGKMDLNITKYHPFEGDLDVRILWSSHPVLDILTRDEYTEEEAVIAVIENFEEAQEVRRSFVEECREIEREREKIRAYIAPFLEKGEVNLIENEDPKQPTYAIGNHLNPILLQKIYRDRTFQYKFTTFFGGGGEVHENLNQMFEKLQKELPILLELNKVKKEILSTLWTLYDPYAFQYSNNCYFVNHENRFLLLNLKENEKQMIFEYQFLAKEKQEYANLNKLKRAAIDEMKKELAPLRLKRLYADNRKHFTRIEKMYNVPAVSLDDFELINEALHIPFSESRLCENKHKVERDQIGTVYFKRKKGVMFVALSQERLETIDEEEE